MKTQTLLFAIILLCASTAMAKPKSGTLIITTDTPLTVTIDGGAAVPVYYGSQSFELVVGVHTIVTAVSDGAFVTRTVTIRAKCVTTLTVTYTPPVIPPAPVAPAPTPCPTPEPPKPEAPEVVPPKLFDACCGCKSDDLKARLDNFAIELHHDPWTRGLVEAAQVQTAIDYFVNQRGIDRSRLSTGTISGNCVRLWVLGQ